MTADTPAEPILASALVGHVELGTLFSRVVNPEGPPAPREGALVTSSKSVDSALGGGLEAGKVVGIWDEVDGGGVEMCISLMVDSLLNTRISTAAVVDTSGNFDIFRLYSFILARLQDDSELFKKLNHEIGLSEKEGMGIEDVAAKVLDRVKIMRVFDLVGVMEAVEEIRDELQQRMEREENGLTELDLVENRPPEKEPDRVMHEEPPPDDPPNQNEVENSKGASKRTFVADSDDEDEMLFDQEPTVQTYPTIPSAEGPLGVEEDEILFVDGADDQIFVSPPPDSSLQSAPQKLKNTEAITDGSSASPAFLLIDNLAHVVRPLLKKEYVQAQALTSSFLLTLSHLTRNHNLYTLISNPATPPRPQYVNPGLEPDDRQHPPPISIFSSKNDVPALLGMLTPYLDLSLIVGRMPRGKNDAKAVHVDGEMVRRVRAGVKMVNVVEVMSDRLGSRGGSWGAFLHDERGIRDI